MTDFELKKRFDHFHLSSRPVVVHSRDVNQSTPSEHNGSCSRFVCATSLLLPQDELLILTVEFFDTKKVIHFTIKQLQVLFVPHVGNHRNSLSRIGIHAIADESYCS